jgi:hypothetical protein
MKIFFFTILILLSCKSRESNSLASIDNAQNVQWVVKPRMIFKFRCKDTEQLPDCEDYDVMRVSRFAAAMGYNHEQVEQIRSYTDGLKAFNANTKQLEKLEAGYAKAKEKRTTISAAQQKAYELKRDELIREIERFKQIPSNLWAEVQKSINDPALREKYFKAEGGEISAGDIHTCALRLDGRLLCWGDDDKRQVSGKNAVIDSGQLKLPIQSVSAGRLNTPAPLDLRKDLCLLGI